jgi:hypothetical protein
MTVTTTDASAKPAARLLRAHVRDCLEREYLRLRSVDRPALRELMQEDDAGTDAVVVGRELTLVEERITAIHDYLGAVHHPHLVEAVCLDCCVLLDTGDGPQWFLLAALPIEDERVIAADSSLGRALVGARPGQSVRYRNNAGPRIARVLELEPSECPG